MVSFSQVLCQDDISFCSNAMLFVLGGDQSRHRIDPGPNSSQHEQSCVVIDAR
jgi:hypothetical protein